MVQAMALITDLMADMDLMDRMLLPIAGPTEVLSFFFSFFECLKLTGIVDGNLFGYYESSTGAPNTF